MAGIHMLQCFHAAGLPAGLLSLATGRGSEIGDFLTQHPGVNCISFTGGDTGGCGRARGQRTWCRARATRGGGLQEGGAAWRRRRGDRPYWEGLGCRTAKEGEQGQQRACLMKGQEQPRVYGTVRLPQGAVLQRVTHDFAQLSDRVRQEHKSPPRRGQTNPQVLSGRVGTAVLLPCTARRVTWVWGEPAWSHVAALPAILIGTAREASGAALPACPHLPQGSLLWSLPPILASVPRATPHHLR